MKKIIFLSLLAFTLSLLSSHRLPAQSYELYFPLVSMDYCTNQHLQLNFLAFGDSITGCYYDSYYQTDFPYCGYEKRVYDRLNQQFGFCPNALAFHNSSEGGEVTSGGLNRFLEAISNPNLARMYPPAAINTIPDLIIIMEGTNDMNVGVAHDIVESNLRQMVDIARQQGKQVILATITPAYGPDEALRQQEIEAFYPRIFNIGQDYGIPVADVYSRLYGHPEWMDADGLHFNDAGFDQMADVFYQAIVDLMFPFS